MEKEQKITTKEKFLKLLKRVKGFEDECNNNRKLLQELLDYSIEDFHEVLNIAQKARELYHRKKEQEFKDGDILHSKGTDRIVIFKGYETELKGVFSSYCNNGNKTNSGWLTHSFRYATKEEKQAFFDDLKAKGLRWNAETKTMEKVRKRAEMGEKYLCINTIANVKEMIEMDCEFDNNHYKTGNYYLLSEREEAEEDVKAIKAIFEKRK